MKSKLIKRSIAKPNIKIFLLFFAQIGLNNEKIQNGKYNISPKTPIPITDSTRVERFAPSVKTPSLIESQFKNTITASLKLSI